MNYEEGGERSILHATASRGVPAGSRGHAGLEARAEPQVGVDVRVRDPARVWRLMRIFAQHGVKIT